MIDPMTNQDGDFKNMVRIGLFLIIMGILWGCSTTGVNPQPDPNSSHRPEESFDKALIQKYRHKKIMDYSQGRFIYADICPERQVGEKVIFAPGIQMTLRLTKMIDLYLAAHHRRVISPMYPDIGMFEKPENIRTQVLGLLLDKYGPAHLIGHGYGCVDIVRLAQQRIVQRRSDQLKSIVLFNPMGLTRKNILHYYYDYYKYVHSGKSDMEKRFLKQWNDAKSSYENLDLLKQAYDATHVNICASIRFLKKQGIKVYIVLTNDTFLYPKDIKPNHIDIDFYLPSIGNHHGIYFDPQHNGGQVILDLLEKVDLGP